MDFIIDFYKSLETLDLIIFWGIIIVIILLLIFSFILINKNKKLKKIIVNNDKIENEETYNEELPIKKEIKTQNELTNNNQSLNENNSIKQENIDNQLPEIPTITDNDNLINNTIELEKNFIAEEHIMELNKQTSNQTNSSKANLNNEEKNTNSSIKKNQPLEMPTGPYQRNVLREMSLSQTSPIGLTSPKRKDDKNIELAKDLDESLNFEDNDQILSTKEINSQIRNELPNINTKKELYEQPKETPKRETIQIKRTENKSENKNEISLKQQEKIYHQNFEKNKHERITTNNHHELTNNPNQPQNDISKKQEQPKKEEYLERRINLNENKIIKEELTSINTSSPRKTEIIDSNQNRDLNKNKTIEYVKENQNNEQQKNQNNDQRNHQNNNEVAKDNIDPRVRELLNSVSKPLETETTKSSSEKYLEEVSRKLAEAEIPDEIERTDYELEQEENAIISYKELMEKKDSIQTIDEEEAIISIEELMNRSKNKEENNSVKEDNKLYNLTEEEENDDFIKELKQFRSDL